MTPRVVLVTGVSRYLGGSVAHALAAVPSIERVIGVDSVPPHPALSGHSRAEFVRTDIRSPLLAKVMDAAEVDTVVHMNVAASPNRGGGRTVMKELNVLGTMQLLAACQRSERVRRLVVKSTSAVYGASSRDPALFTEQMQAKRVPTGGFAKDAVEIETYVRGFQRRRPDVQVSVLRFCNFIGPQIDSILAPYLSLPVVPVMLGYDARLQLLHEDDAVAVIVRASTSEDDGVAGITNVAGAGVVMLSQALRRAGRISLALPPGAGGLVGRTLRSLGVADYSPEQMRFLNFGRVVDTTALIERFGYVPQYSTVAALDDFVRRRGLRPVRPVPWAMDALNAFGARGSQRG